MNTIFATGGCRCYFPLTYLHTQGKISMVNPCATDGIESETFFFGNLHNILEHEEIIQAMIEPEPTEERIQYYMRRLNGQKPEYRARLHEIWERNRRMFPEADTVAIEVCSIKESKFGLPSTTPKDILDAVGRIEQLIPDKKILWHCHLRPQIFRYQRDPIRNREVIYETLRDQVDLFDPSEHMKAGYLMDLEHYNLQGLHHISQFFLDRIS